MVSGGDYLKTFLDDRMFLFCTPVIYGSSKLLSTTRKSLNLANFNFNLVKEDFKLSMNAIQYCELLGGRTDTCLWNP